MLVKHWDNRATYRSPCSLSSWSHSLCSNSKILALHEIFGSLDRYVGTWLAEESEDESDSFGGSAALLWWRRTGIGVGSLCREFLGHDGGN